MTVQTLLSDQILFRDSCREAEEIIHEGACMMRNRILADKQE